MVRECHKSDSAHHAHAPRALVPGGSAARSVGRLEPGGQLLAVELVGREVAPPLGLLSYSLGVRASSRSPRQVCQSQILPSFWQCPRRGRASQRRAGRRLAAWPRLASVDGHPCTMERLRPAEVGPAGTRTRASPRGWAEVQLVGRRRSCLCRRWMIKTRIRAGRRVAANRRAGAGPRRPMSRMRRPRGTRGHFAFGRPARACCSNSDHDSMAELEAPRAPTMRARRRPPALI